MSAVRQANTDCFAYDISFNKYVRAECRILSDGELLCMKQECPFYKKRTPYLNDLLNRHKTDDIDVICNRYAKQKEEERKAGNNKPEAKENDNSTNA